MRPDEPSRRRKGGVRAVFICSAGHSGSTLLDLLLGSHPAAAALGEIAQLPKNLALNTPCTCGATARDCVVWRAVLCRLEEHPDLRGVARNPYMLNLGLIKARDVVDRRRQTPARLAYRKAVHGLAFAHWRWGLAPLSPFAHQLYRTAESKWLLFDAVAHVLERDVLIDSSKHYLQAVSLYKTAPSRARVVLLLRDGRAVYYSGLKRGRPRREALEAWRRTYARAIPLLERHVSPEHMVRVRYEDLAEAPEETLRGLCGFIGIEYTPAMLRFGETAHHVLNGNDMRFGDSARIKPDVAWRSRLSGDDLRYFEAKAGSLNRALGYV